MSTYESTETLDVKGLPCLMPVIKTRDVVDELESGEIPQIVTTDSGSMSDLKGWADVTDGVAILDQEETEEDDDAVLRYFIQKE